MNLKLSHQDYQSKNNNTHRLTSPFKINYYRQRKVKVLDSQ